MSNTSLYGSAITEVVPISENTSPYSTTAIGVVSANNTTGLYSNASNFTTGQVNSSVYSVNAGTGVTVNPTTGNVLVSIGQPVGPGDSPSFMSLYVTGPGVFQTEPDVAIFLEYSQIAIGDGSSGLQGLTFQGLPNSGFLYFDPVTDTFIFTNGTSGFGTPFLTLGSTSAEFNEPIKLNGSTSGSSQFAVPATGSTLTYTLPGTAGAANSVLTNNGSGTLSWTTVGGLGVVTSITGTANQIIASSSTGAVTLSTPQDIATTSSPTFANMTLTGDLAVNGGDITTTAATFNLVNATATTVNLAGAATTMTIGSASGGNVTVRPALQVNSSIRTTTGDLLTSSATSNLFNTTATTLNIGGAATAVNIGAGTGTTTVNNNFKSIGTISTNYYTLPLTDGIGGQVINTDGSGNLGWVDGSFTIGDTAIALGDTTLTLTGLTSVEVTQDPVTNLQLATKQYVDNIATTGLTFHAPVQAATTASLASITGGTVTYNQPGGPGVGVGATITLSVALTVLDGYTLLNTNRILVKDETNQTYNGVYTWATGGTVLTRATDADTYGSGVNQLSLNDYFFVQNGTTQANIAYVLNAPVGAIVFGTSAITFAEFSRSNVYTGVSPIDVTGTVISLTTVPINLGGTGQTTANDAINALLPSQTLNTGRLLTTNGTDTSWVDLATIGVTSVSGSGAGVSVSPTTGAVVVSNTGVTSIVAGTNISISGATGAVTINSTDTNTTYNIDASTATGGANLNLNGSDSTTDSVKFAQGTGITVSRTDANTITITNSDPGSAGVTSITGTANQIIASASTGAVTLSTPQDIATTSSPTFADMTLTGDLAVNGGDITTTQTTATLYNTTATTVNIGGAATLINAGTTTGTFNIRNPSLVLGNGAGNIQIAGRSITQTAALTTSTTTADQVLVSIAFAFYHNLKYQVNIVSGGNYHSADIAITTNGTTSYITVSNEMWTSTSLTDWNTDISGANVRLLVTPTNAVTTYKVYYTGLN